ncbi:MAG: YbaB/EbfC family nucleoid-associated protein [Candidatus Sericytochromatia bacterium]
MKPLGKRNAAPGGGGLNNMSQMLEQAQRMQQSLMEVQEKLGDDVLEGTAGNGAVRISMTGKHEVRDVKIDPAIIDPDDLEMLEDMLVAAFNNALETANQHAAAQMNSVTGGLQIPGMDGLF